MKFARTKKHNSANVLIINMDFIEYVEVDNHKGIMTVFMHSGQQISLSKEEPSCFRKTLFEYNQNLKSQLLSHIIEE